MRWESRGGFDALESGFVVLSEQAESLWIAKWGNRPARPGECTFTILNEMLC